MRPTSFETPNLQVVGTETPTVLASVFDAPARVKVRNLGPLLVFLSVDERELASIPPGSATSRLPVGAENIVVLAPKQRLFAIANGINCSVSVEMSEAIPFDRII